MKKGYLAAALARTRDERAREKLSSHYQRTGGDGASTFGSRSAAYLVGYRDAAEEYDGLEEQLRSQDQHAFELGRSRQEEFDRALRAEGRLKSAEAVRAAAWRAISRVTEGDWAGDDYLFGPIQAFYEADRRHLDQNDQQGDPLGSPLRREK